MFRLKPWICGIIYFNMNRREEQQNLAIKVTLITHDNRLYIVIVHSLKA